MNDPMTPLTPIQALRHVERDVAGRAHLVGLSGGKDSTCLAMLMRERCPDVPLTFGCTPTGNELPEMVEHWMRLAALVAPRPFLFIQAHHNGSPVSLETLIAGFGALPNHRQRWCTRKLKIEPWAAFMRGLMQDGPVTSYVGLRADEEERRGLYGDGFDVQFPLRDWGMGLSDVVRALEERGVCVPRRTDCAWCYEQRLVEWQVLEEEHPDIYEAAAAWEDRIGATFRSPSRDDWPAGLRDLLAEFKTGRQVRGSAAYRRGKDTCRVCHL